MRPLHWILVPLFLLLQYAIWIGPGGIMSIYGLHRQILQETQVNQEWDMKNQQLIADIRDLKNGNQAIEDHARSDLGMVKAKEILYQLP